jgi:hypothetical protein
MQRENEGEKKNKEEKNMAEPQTWPPGGMCA